MLSLVIRLSALIAPLGVCALVTAGAQEQARTAAVAGTVRDSADRPIGRAEILVEATPLAALSDDSGRFHLAGVPAGRHGFLIRKLGYDPVAFETTLAPDSTLVLAVRMITVQALDAAVVTGERRSPRLVRDGFYERQRTGIGSYLSPEQIATRSWATRPSEILRGVRGLKVTCGRISCRVRSQTPYPEGPCMWVWVDGKYMRGELDDAVSVTQIYAMEVYEHNAMVPLKFQGPMPMKGAILSKGGGCGAIAVWTTTREP